MCSKTGRQFHEFCLARQVPHADNQITIFTESIINKKRRKKAKGAAIELIDVSKKAITQTDGAQSLEPSKGFQIGSTTQATWQGKKARAPRAKKGKKPIPPPRRRPRPADLSSAEWATQDDGSWLQLPHTHGLLAS